MLTIAGKDTSVMANLDNFALDTTPNYSAQNATLNQNLMHLQNIDAFHEPFEGAFPEAK